MIAEAPTYGSVLEHRHMDAEEKILSLFESDPVTTAEYFENLRRKTFLEPEKKLMLAVLEDAVKCYQYNVVARTVHRKKLFQEVEEWIVEEDRSWLFSFENICDVLGLNPAYVRQGLLRYKQQTLPSDPGRSVWAAKKWPAKPQ